MSCGISKIKGINRGLNLEKEEGYYFTDRRKGWIKLQRNIEVEQNKS